jgi:hypothetical protein
MHSSTSLPMHHRLVTRTSQLAMLIHHSTSSTQCVNRLICRCIKSASRPIHRSTITLHKSAQPIFTNQLVLLKHRSAMPIRTRSAKYAYTHTDQLRHSCFRKHLSAKVIDAFIDQLGNRCTIGYIGQSTQP